MNYNVDCSNIKNIMHIPRPAPICAPRGGHRYKPRPRPRRHHLTHAAGMGHTSPQRRHQHKARAMSHAHGPQPPHDTPQTKATLPCINQRYKAGWLYFFIVAKIESGPNGYHITTPICDHYRQNTTPANLTEPSCRPLKPEQYGQYADPPCQAYTYHISDMYNCPAP